MQHRPIRVLITTRRRVQDVPDKRTEFWHSLGMTIREEIPDEDDIARFESRIVTQLGLSLRNALIEHLLGVLGPFFERRYKDEVRQQVYMGRFLSSSFPELQEKISSLATVTFSFRIQGYSSLELGLIISSVSTVAKVFDNNFDDFRFFLDAYLPEAFEDTFGFSSARHIDVLVDIPESITDEFSARNGAQQPLTSSAALASGPADSIKSTKSARQEWLSKIITGSLLVPVILALIVLYEGAQTFKEMGASQNALLKPILDYQIQIMQEDRLRLSKERAVHETEPSVASKDKSMAPAVDKK